MIAEPPLAGGVKRTMADELPPSTASITGAAGTVVVMPSATAEATPGPAALTARISTGYTSPPTSGVVPSDDTGDAQRAGRRARRRDRRHVAPPSVEYWYVMIGLPPSEAGAVKATSRLPSSPTIVSSLIVGAPGTVRGAADTVCRRGAVAGGVDCAHVARCRRPRWSSPVIVIGLDVDAGERGDPVSPPSIEYS